jgi:hypothetical protein
VSQLLKSVDSDLNDPLIQAALSQMEKKDGNSKPKNDSSSKKRKNDDNDQT